MSEIVKESHQHQASKVDTSFLLEKKMANNPAYINALSHGLNQNTIRLDSLLAEKAVYTSDRNQIVTELTSAYMPKAQREPLERRLRRVEAELRRLDVAIADARGYEVWLRAELARFGL